MSIRTLQDYKKSNPDFPESCSFCQQALEENTEFPSYVVGLTVVAFHPDCAREFGAWLTVDAMWAKRRNAQRGNRSD